MCSDLSQHLSSTRSGNTPHLSKEKECKIRFSSTEYRLPLVTIDSFDSMNSSLSIYFISLPSSNAKQNSQICQSWYGKMMNINNDRLWNELIIINDAFSWDLEATEIRNSWFIQRHSTARSQLTLSNLDDATSTFICGHKTMRWWWFNRKIYCHVSFDKDGVIQHCHSCRSERKKESLWMPHKRTLSWHIR